MSNASEAHLVELVTWLEQTGHEADVKKHFANFCSGNRTSCHSVGYHFARVEDEGIFEVQFWFPFPELEKACPIDNESELVAWLDSISTNGIEAEIVEHKKMGKCVLVKRLHYIPTADRDKFLSPDVLPGPEFAVLSRLLNLRIAQGNAAENPSD